jgi:ElaB/YqjD/DUF883 family membrane-anchored ribosome-binding protein
MDDEEVMHSTNDLATNINNKIDELAKDLATNINSKIDELSKSIDKLYGEKKGYTESKINENPIAYVAGAFVGGVVIGYIMCRR